MVTGSSAASFELPDRRWVNTLIGKVKTAVKGIYHKAGPQHLPCHLAEFRCRPKRRFDRVAMLLRLTVLRRHASRPCIIA